VPDLDTLIRGFEQSDDTIAKQEAEAVEHLNDLKNRGFEPEPREEVKQKKLLKSELLDKNISEHRRLLQAALPGMAEDLNAGVADPLNKISLR